MLFDDCSSFPIICEAVKNDNSLHVKLHYCNNPVALPDWFSQRRNSKLTKFSMSESFPIYLKSFADDHFFLSKLQNKNITSLKDNLPICQKNMFYFAFAVHIFTGIQTATRRVLLSFITLLAKLKSGKLDAIKAAKLLRQKKYYQTTLCLTPMKCI